MHLGLSQPCLPPRPHLCPSPLLLPLCSGLIPVSDSSCFLPPQEECLLSLPRVLLTPSSELCYLQSTLLVSGQVLFLQRSSLNFRELQFKPASFIIDNHGNVFLPLVAVISLSSVNQLINVCLLLQSRSSMRIETTSIFTHR